MLNGKKIVDTSELIEYTSMTIFNIFYALKLKISWIDWFAIKSWSIVLIEHSIQSIYKVYDPTFFFCVIITVITKEEKKREKKTANIKIVSFNMVQKINMNICGVIYVCHHSINSIIMMIIISISLSVDQLHSLSIITFMFSISIYSSKSIEWRKGEK